MKDFPKQIDFDAYAAGICQAYMSAGREAIHFAGPTRLRAADGSLTMLKIEAARWLFTKAPDPTGIVQGIRQTLHEAKADKFETWQELAHRIIATQPETLEYIAERYKTPLRD